MDAKPLINTPAIMRTKEIRRIAARTKMRTRNMERGRHATVAPCKKESYFFLAGADFFAPGATYFVSIVVPIVCSMPFADSAYCPSGLKARYFWNASEVPSGNVILPSAATLAFDVRQIPY